MSSVARTLGRLLTAVLLSTAVALGPTAFSGPDAMAAPYPDIEISETAGRPGTYIDVRGSGFDDCYLGGLKNAVGDTTKRRPGTVELSMGNAAPATTAPVDIKTGTFQSRLTVSDDATPDDYPVTAVCTTKTDIRAEETFTVEREEEAALTLDPTEGRPEAEFVADGSAFNCSSVDVTWDDTESLATAVPVSETGTFTERLQVPEGASEGTHTVEASCTDEEYDSDSAEFTVTATQTNGNGNGTTSGGQTDGGQTNGGQTSGGTDGGTNGGTNGQVGGTSDGGGTVDGTGSVDSSTPVGLVVGPALGGVLLLAAAGLALVRHRQRGPRWVHDHVSTVLRPGTARSDVREPYDTGPPTRTVRLEPHLDPGDQSVDGTDRG